MIGQVAVELIHVLSFDFLDVLQLKNQLPTLVELVNVLEKIHRTTVVKNQVPDLSAGVNPTLFGCEIEVRIEQRGHELPNSVFVDLVCVASFARRQLQNLLELRFRGCDRNW